MVNFNASVLDRTFAALADPTRRALLAQLEDRRNRSVSELAQPFAMSLPAIMKHLDVLSDAGLVTRSKTGRTVTCQLTAAPLEEAMTWLTRGSALIEAMKAGVAANSAVSPGDVP